MNKDRARLVSGDHYDRESTWRIRKLNEHEVDDIFIGPRRSTSEYRATKKSHGLQSRSLLHCATTPSTAAPFVCINLLSPLRLVMVDRLICTSAPGRILPEGGYVGISLNGSAAT
jgi:hypothetical protein